MHNLREQATIPTKQRVEKLGSSVKRTKLQRLFLMKGLIDARSFLQLTYFLFFFLFFLVKAPGHTLTTQLSWAWTFSHQAHL